MCVTEDDRIAGRRLRKLRKARGFSQVALADALGISFQQVQKYERGLNRMTIGRISMICQFFNISALYFFNVPFEEYEMAKNFHRCNKERRKILLALAETYAMEEGGGSQTPDITLN